MNRPSWISVSTLPRPSVIASIRTWDAFRPTRCPALELPPGAGRGLLIRTITRSGVVVTRTSMSPLA